VAIPKLVAAIGLPASASAERLEWAVMTSDMCVHVVATADRDGFVKTVESQGISDGADHYAQCKKLARKHVKLPAKLKGPPKVDVDEPARALMTLWHDGKFKDLFEA